MISRKLGVPPKADEMPVSMRISRPSAETTMPARLGVCAMTIRLAPNAGSSASELLTDRRRRDLVLAGPSDQAAIP